MHNYKKINTRIPFVLRFIPILLSCIFILSSCDSAGSVSLYDQMGTYGADMAKKIAAEYPRRIAGSEQEKAVSDNIVKEFKRYGYVPEVQTFTLEDGSSSQNIIVRIPGTGFVADEDLIDDFDYSIYGKKAAPKEGVFRRQVIIAARYDTSPNAEEGSDGLSDNASGVGALLLTAQTLKKVPIGYDVILVAFGGGFAKRAGANAFMSQLTEAEKKITDVFYEYRSLYSGGKLYAHAGYSSLNLSRKYALRQPLYAIADTAINVSLLPTAGIPFYTNQSLYLIDNPYAEATTAEETTGETTEAEGTEGTDAGEETDKKDQGDSIAINAAKVPFREISATSSDYSVFDKAGIPIVFFESYDYSAETYDELVENVDPSVASTNYKIRGTAFDNTKFLATINEKDFLQRRINATVYLVIETLKIGVLGSK